MLSGCCGGVYVGCLIHSLFDDVNDDRGGGGGGGGLEGVQDTVRYVIGVAVAYP